MQKDARAIAGGPSNDISRDAGNNVHEGREADAGKRDHDGRAADASADRRCDGSKPFDAPLPILALGAGAITGAVFSPDEQELVVYTMGSNDLLHAKRLATEGGFSRPTPLGIS